MAFHVEKEKRTDNAHLELSPLVRSSLDETYSKIGNQKKREGRTKWSRLRLMTSSAAAAGILGIAVFTTAFVSPVMADSLRSIPVIGSIFSTLEGDSGLRTAGDQGLFASVNREISHDDVKLSVTDTIYDGTRAAFLLTVDAPNLKNGVYDNGRKTMKLGSAVEQIVLTGESNGVMESSLNEAGGLFFGSAGEEHPNTLVVEQVLPYLTPSQAPDAFEASVTIKLDGIDHEFAVDIPFRKTTQESIEVTPNLSSENEQFYFRVAAVGVTPVTSRIATTLEFKKKTALTSKEERRLTRIGIAVFDDQGRRLTALNGEGIVEGNKIVYDRRFATTPGTSAYFMVKPFRIEDDFAEEVKEDQFLKGLEVKVELPSTH